MSDAADTAEFEPLPMKRRAVAGMDASQYWIRGTAGESIEIKADTAYEAFRKSGVNGIIKIERVFNLNQNLLPESKLLEYEVEDAGADKTSKGSSLQDRILHRRNPILSPDELDIVMRSPHVEEERKRDTASIENVPPILDLPPVPEPEITSGPTGVPSPIGLDVHGDGFDEIIPAAPPSKPSAVKSVAEPKAIHGMPAHPEEAAQDGILPEKELTSEEVAKLLSGEP